MLCNQRALLGYKGACTETQLKIRVWQSANSPTLSCQKGMLGAKGPDIVQRRNFFNTELKFHKQPIEVSEA